MSTQSPPLTDNQTQGSSPQLAALQAAAEETLNEIAELKQETHNIFVAAGTEADESEAKRIRDELQNLSSP